MHILDLTGKGLSVYFGPGWFPCPGPLTLSPKSTQLPSPKHRTQQLTLLTNQHTEVLSACLSFKS